MPDIQQNCITPVGNNHPSRKLRKFHLDIEESNERSGLLTVDIGNAQAVLMILAIAVTGSAKNAKVSLQRIRHTNSHAIKDAGAMKGNPSIMGWGLDTSTKS